MILHQDHRSPPFSLAIAYGAGWLDDPPDRSELAHLTEHLTFRGMLPQFEEAERPAAEFNGGTHAEASVYHVLDDVRHLDRWLWIESRRLADFAPTDVALKLEREIVERELDQRTGYRSHLAEVIDARLFAPSDRVPMMDARIRQLRRLELEDVLWFHRTHYRPENATLAIVGPLSPDAIMARVKTWFGPIRSEPAPPRPFGASSAANACPSGLVKVHSGFRVDRAYLYLRGGRQSGTATMYVAGNILTRRLETAVQDADRPFGRIRSRCRCPLVGPSHMAYRRCR